MAYEDYETKESVVIAYTGEGKGKTTASLGLLERALGSGKSVAYIQFVKHWVVGEHTFIADIQDLYKDKLLFYRGGKGFYEAGEHSAKGVTKEEHKQTAQDTLKKANKAAASGKYDVVICDEINNVTHDGLISQQQVTHLISNKSKITTLCLTGRNFPEELIDQVDIATEMVKIKHHFDDKYLANKGVDY